MLGSALDWFDTHSVDLAVAALLVIACRPLVVLAHELGHAAVGLVRTEGLVRVRVGRSPGIWRARLGRLSLELHPVPARGDSPGETVTHARFGWRSRVMLALAGPIAGSGVALASSCSASIPGSSHSRSLAASCSSSSSATSCLLGAPQGRTMATRSLKHFARSGVRRRTTNSQMWKAASWYLSQMPHRASLRGLIRADIAGVTADELVREGPDLAVASPTLGSLDYGLRRALASSFTSGVRLEHARFAFHFGVAMHDVVAIAG